ncbi:TIGR04104 family putative zinc finger protein [Ureibacillus manganicus]|uniref:CXXC-20-CXXC protein n=1 Tax=Ureibacillus manganicus DSM 26584 TaxID=1384049 RepID=A0A0A3I4V5_9BACL|nr:TIGR04104 family putative zinc finger protein [Ureibacillus manganicus]KGR77708.1 hypothetical protein CD29_13725 [Ureibacillus manganicus DSM 26584]
MGIQYCNECNKKLSWSSKVKSIWLGYKPIQCEGCKKEYRIEFKTRYKATLYMIIPLFIFAKILSSTFILPTIYFFGTVLLFGVSISFLMPFVVNYKSEHK